MTSAFFRIGQNYTKKKMVDTSIDSNETSQLENRTEKYVTEEKQKIALMETRGEKIQKKN